MGIEKRCLDFQSFNNFSLPALSTTCFPKCYLSSHLDFLPGNLCSGRACSHLRGSVKVRQVPGTAAGWPPDCKDTAAGVGQEGLYHSSWLEGGNTHPPPLCGIPGWLSGKESACQCRRPRFSPWSRKIPCRRQWRPFPVFLPGEFHGQRSLVGHSPWSRRVGHDWSNSACMPLFAVGFITADSKLQSPTAEVLPALSFIRHTILLPRLPAPVHTCRRQSSGDSSWSSRGQMRFPG